MLSRPWLTTTSKAAASLALLLTAFTACQHSKPPPPPPPKIVYSPTYDAEIKEIMDLAGKSRWEEAELKVNLLYQQDPRNPMIERIHTWVAQEGHKRRTEALENSIRDVDARNSVFNPTIPSLLTEKKDRGLPASKDVRDTVHRIESSPYIPETFGKTSYEKGPLFDLESTKGRMAKVLEKDVSIHLDNVPLENIIMNLSQTAGINIVAD